MTLSNFTQQNTNTQMQTSAQPCSQNTSVNLQTQRLPHTDINAAFLSLARGQMQERRVTAMRSLLLPCSVCVQISCVSPGPALKQEIPETPQIKEEPEEQSIKQEEEQLTLGVPDYFTVVVKTEESSPLQQNHTEAKEEQTQGEDISTEPHFHSETEGDTEHSSDTDNDEDWRAPLSCSDQVQTRGSSTAPQNSALSSRNNTERDAGDNGHTSAAAQTTEEKKYQCSVCDKRYRSKSGLKIHFRSHTGENTFSCSVCEKTFITKGIFIVHMRTHTGEKPFSCSVCEKSFSENSTLTVHMRKHTGEKPYSCPICEKTFPEKGRITSHMRIHTRDRPFSCSVCEKTYFQKHHLTEHMTTHTGEKPYSCSTCQKTFSKRNTLALHLRTHTGDRRYACSVCEKTFYENRGVRALPVRLSPSSTSLPGLPLVPPRAVCALLRTALLWTRPDSDQQRLCAAEHKR
ncbi:hypothetical protein WMY93_028466 [Mugilogobius chulae]|uniref:C2H2-type domain-containing protein n=1 Tax=Mugilogobius chulae TaxID=88201 RepID=A0AAW0MND1_9GOBI